jgi:catechol 2,3-dioxygenase-like lactoylglutathione lyase family enzyme
MPLLNLHHIAIRAPDLEGSKRFYTEVLGLTDDPRRPNVPGVPGNWLNIVTTQIHTFAGHTAVQRDGKRYFGIESIDHVAFQARDFDGMKRRLDEHGIEWRQLDQPSANIWQLFFHDPNGVLFELNFDSTKEPQGARGPDETNKYIPGDFVPRRP